MSQCSKSLLADYVALSEVNYIYPSYTLPSNNFYNRIQKNPYFLANDLRNNEISASRSSKNFHANPAATMVASNQLNWSNARLDTSVPLSSSATKTLEGPYLDTLNNKAGISYHYKWDNTLQLVPPTSSTQGYVLIGLNLDASSQDFVNNVLKYTNNTGVDPNCGNCPIQTSNCVSPPNNFNPCDPGNPYVPGLDGTITLMHGKNSKVIDVKHAVPLVPGQISCPQNGDDDEDSPVQFAILGNRMYLAVEKDSDSEWNQVKVSVSAQIVEEKKTSLLSPFM